MLLVTPPGLAKAHAARLEERLAFHARPKLLIVDVQAAPAENSSLTLITGLAIMPPMDAALTTAGLPPPPDPPRDRAGRPVPENLAFVLGLLHVLLAYGQHLGATLQHRAARRSFAVIAQCFGTSRLPAIVARLTRGLMRALALQRVLLARAARGRDLVRRRPEDDPPRKPRNHAAPAAAAEPPPRRRRTPRPDPDAWLDCPGLPSMAALERQVRRRPVGRTLVAICCDLGIGFILCDGGFSIELSHAIDRHRGSYSRYFKTVRRRQKAFEDELDRDGTFQLDWPNSDRGYIRRVLGFFIGDDPVWPESLLPAGCAAPVQPP